MDDIIFVLKESWRKNLEESRENLRCIRGESQRFGNGLKRIDVIQISKAYCVGLGFWCYNYNFYSILRQKR